MALVVRMPSVMAGAADAVLSVWIANEGQHVAVGDPLAEIETEKAVVEYASEAEGTVGRLLASPGDTVEVGAPIAVLLEPGEGADAVGPALAAAGGDVNAEAPAAEAPPATPVASEPAAAATPAEPAAPAPAVASAAPAEAPAPARRDGERIFATPIVRRLAAERGIDLASVAGSGPNGRIVKRDLEGVTAQPAPAASAATAAPSVATSAADYTDVPLSGMRKAIARRLTESKSTVPHFYVTAHIQVGRLLELRRQVNEAAPRKISVNDFVVKAVAGALQDVPAANAIWNGDSIRRFTGVDIAIAVAIENGLLTPVVRGVERLGLAELSGTIAELAERAKAGRLKQEELEGGSFSVSNLGMYGVDEFSAILNPPQSGILAVAAAKPRPVVGADGQLAVANVMTVTLSADHRVIDGAVAAEWMAALVKRIENPLSILL